MFSVKFDFFERVSEVEIYDNTVCFKLSRGVNDTTGAYITACVVANASTVTREVNNSLDPQNSRDEEFDCLAVTPELICAVDDHHNVMAIYDMPFTLTEKQVLILNELLEEMA